MRADTGARTRARRRASGREQVQRFQVDLIELGRSPHTVLARQAGVKRFSRWLAREEEIERDDLAGLPQPQLETAVPEVLTDDQVRALLAICDKSFYGRRDEALIRFLLETMVRAGEALALETTTCPLRTESPSSATQDPQGQGGGLRSFHS